MELDNLRMNDYEEELFCLKFELRTLSDTYCYNKSERWVNGFVTKYTEDHHLDRYKFASKLTGGKRVLDIACGSGFGSFLLATNGNAASVVGVDIDEDAIRYGKHRHANENITRIVGDATSFEYKNKFDVIVSFETVEHIKNYELLINNLYNNLEDEGLLIISTPINQQTTTKLANPYHEIEWSFLDFHKLFENKFEIKEVYLQNVQIITGENRKSPFTKRAARKILRYLLEDNLPVKPRQTHFTGKNMEPYSGQYNMENCIGGYQLLVLKKM